MRLTDHDGLDDKPKIWFHNFESDVCDGVAARYQLVLAGQSGVAAHFAQEGVVLPN